MKIISRATVSIIASVVLMVGILFVFSPPSQAAPVELSSDQKAHIKSECAQIKGSLSQLHATDALLRVNRGQVYEAMLSRLMNPFNSRLNSGGFDNRAMAVNTSQYTASLSLFRADYIAYEQKISEALKLDCNEKPTDFYQAVVDARDLRRTVNDDVRKLHGSLVDYESSVGDFLVNLKRLSN